MAEGDFTSVIDSHEFDVGNGRDCSLVHVYGDIYAVAYRGISDHGMIRTFEIDSAGNIGAGNIDTMKFDDVNGQYTHMIHVSGTVYAIAYTGTSNRPYCATVNIANDGSMGDTAIEKVEFDNAGSDSFFILHTTGNFYAIAYKGWLDQGRIVTLEISAAGDIAAAITDSLFFDTGFARNPVIVHVFGEIYAIAYEGPDSDGFVKTVNIDASGDVGAATIDAWEFDTDMCLVPSFLHVAGNTYAIAYETSGDDGKVITFAIDNTGNITAAVIDFLVFDSVSCYSPFMIHISRDCYAVAYMGDLSDGWSCTFDIEADGTISGAIIDSLEFDTGYCSFPNLVHVSGSVYAVAYQGVDDDGWLKTIDIETIFPSGQRHELIMGIG